MFLELIQHEYFWLSFFPVSFLGIGFWFLFFERSRKKKDPLTIFMIAIFGGVFAAFFCSLFLEKISITNQAAGIFFEEIFKVFFAIGVMELFKQKFETVAGGVVFGFAVGLGFAFAENLFYLESSYTEGGFSPEFWLASQGRFWGSTLLHGTTTAVFGLFYSGAYLSETLFKHKMESALKVLLVPFDIKRFFTTLTFPATRTLLFHTKNGLPQLEKYASRAILFEGGFLAFLLRLIFNSIVQYSSPILAFFIAFFFMWGLRKKMKKF